MLVRHAEAVWEGNLPKGKGNITTGSGAINLPYSFATRFEGAQGTNPEELIGAAHSGCFAMAFSHMLSLAGHIPTKVDVKADVTLDKVGEGFKITKILLTCNGVVPGIDEATFLKIAEEAKKGCPVSQALAATPIELKATLAK